jgi:hypothetical protein
VSRKIKAVATQQVRDALGNVLADVGDYLSEADYDKLEDGAAKAAYQLVIVEDVPAKAQASEPAQAKDTADTGKASDSVSVGKKGGGK